MAQTSYSSMSFGTFDTNSDNMQDIKESSLYSQLPQLLNSDLSLQARLVELILGRTSSHEVCTDLIGSHEVLASLLYLIIKHPTDIGKAACRALINVSSYQEGCNVLLSPAFEAVCHKIVGESFSPVVDLMRLIVDGAHVEMAELLCCLMNNLTRSAGCAAQVADVILQDDLLRTRLLSAADEKLARLEHMPFLYANLAQDIRVRRLLLNHNSNFFEVFPPMLQDDLSPVHHSGVVCLIKNCCFEYDEHEWLLGPEVDLLSYLLWPVAGPEQFDEEDTGKLPVGLQYLSKEKTRDTSKSVRLMVLEALYKLCAKQQTREILRSKNVYIILRELDKWEKDLELSEMLSAVVNILIQTEAEIGADFLPGLSIPEDVKTQFENPSHEVDTVSSEEVQLIS